MIDTLTLARKYYRFPSNTLAHICISLNIEVKNEHRAMGDILLTKGVFEKFLNDFRKVGIITLEELLFLQGGSIPFPKAKEIVLPPLLEEVFKKRGKIKITYLSSNAKKSVRVIEPLELTLTRNYFYLHAFCHLC